MKARILLPLLLACALPLCAQVLQITDIQYQIDGGAFTNVNVPDGATVNWNEVVSTLGLGDGLHRLRVRAVDDLGRIGVVTDGFFSIATTDFAAQRRVITDISYQIDNGGFVNVDVPDGAIVNWADVISTLGLPDGLHRLRVRGTDDLGRTGVVTDGFFAIVTTNFTGQHRVMTSLSYQINDGAFVNVDVPDGAIVNWADVLPTTGLPNGLHRLRVRGTDDLGRTGLVHDGFFATVTNDFTGQTRLVTQMEYRFDDAPFTVVDNADAPLVNFSELLATAGLGIGLHTLDLRGTDDQARTGAVTRAFLIVSSPFVAGQPRTITAAEYFVNVDPGPGNGVPIPLPQDGAYDEGEENVQTVLTTLPIGLHRVGFRTRDDLGRWSQVMADSILVGPILVVRSVGNDIILDWQSGPGVDQFYIYRSAIPTGSFTRIDSTAATTYTDAGIAGSQLKQFYHVTFNTNSLSTYRLPAAPQLAY